MSEHHELHRLEKLLEQLGNTLDAIAMVLAYESKVLKQILINTTPRRSATLHYKGKRMTTILKGKTATPTFQEWSGPNGTGDKLPPVGQVTYASADDTKVSVDPNSGIVTGVDLTDAAGIVITATDAGNGLTATASIVVTEVAVSATLDFTPNP